MPLRSLPKFKERMRLKIKQWILIRTPASEEITQGKLILLSGRWLENSFCAVVISFCPCNYEVIWEASALTIRKCALVCLNRTRSLLIPCAPWHDCLMSTVFQKTHTSLYPQLPSGVWNYKPKLSGTVWCVWRELIPFGRVTEKPVSPLLLKRRRTTGKGYTPIYLVPYAAVVEGNEKKKASMFVELWRHRRKWGLEHVKKYKRLCARASLIVCISVSVSEPFSGRSDRIKTMIDGENYGRSPSIITLSVVSTCKYWIQPLCAPHSDIYSAMPARELPMLVSSLNYWRTSHNGEKE